MPAASLLIRVDARSRLGLQQQIYTAVRRAILDGVAAPGARVPSSRALADDLSLSRTTTLLAYEQLIAEGYLTGRQGSGTYVAAELPDDLPRSIAPRRTPRTRHPPLSRRGIALVNTPSSARRIAGPPRAFRIGVPGLDLFPARLWSQLAGRRLRRVTIAQLDYGDVAGWLPLRRAIAQHVEAARSTRCSADQVIVVAGAQRGVEFICQSLLDPGDTAWIEEPGYAGTRSALTAAGARIVPVRVDEDGLDVAAGVAAAPDARLACVTPSHQFPAGVPMTLPRRIALLKWAASARAWIVEDDYDSEFRYSTRPIPCLHGLDADGRVIYVGSFAKTLFPALRLGFLIVPADVQARLLDARRASDMHPQSLDQVVLADFLKGGHYERHLRRMRSAYRERLEALTDAIDRYANGALTLRPVRTGLHAVADLVGADASDVSERARASGIESMPLAAYYMSRQRPSNALVLGFSAIRPDAITAGTIRLMEAIDAARRPQRARPGSRSPVRG